MLRPGDGPVSQSPSSSQTTPGRPSDTPAIPTPRQASDVSANSAGAPLIGPSENPAAGATPPQQIQPLPDSSGRQPETVTPASTEPVNENPAANSTPLLDAAIERVAAVTHQDESTDAGTPPFPSKNEAPRAEAQGPSAGASIAPALELSEAPRTRDTLVSNAVNGPSLIKPDDAPAAKEASAVPKVETPAARAEIKPKSDTAVQSDSTLAARDTPARSNERAHPAIDVTKPEPVSVDPDPLGISKLSLCRKVLGFGSFESLADTRVKVGQRLLLYCEMTGMQYEEKHSEFVSRLSSRIEITSIVDGTIVWKHELGPEKDVCGSRRHDFYVNYRVDLPSSLPAGVYRLRLTQNDLVAQRSTSAEIPLEIVP
jgi:hypothetical protein